MEDDASHPRGTLSAGHVGCPVPKLLDHGPVHAAKDLRSHREEDVSLVVKGVSIVTELLLVGCVSSDIGGDGATNVEVCLHAGVDHSLVLQEAPADCSDDACDSFVCILVVADRTVLLQVGDGDTARQLTIDAVKGVTKVVMRDRGGGVLIAAPEVGKSGVC